MLENKGTASGNLIGGIAIFVCSLALWVQLLHERDHDGTNYMPVVLSLILYVTSLGLVAWAVHINVRDANRAKRLRAEIVTIKDESKFQIGVLEERLAEANRRPRMMEPWEQYGSREVHQKAVDEQNRLITLGRSVDGLSAPIQIEIFRLRMSIIEWFLTIPECPALDNTGIYADDADRRTAAHNRKVSEWSELIRHGYAVELKPRVIQLAHMLGAIGLDVQELESRSASVGTDEEAAEIIFELGELAVQAEGKR